MVRNGRVAFALAPALLLGIATTAVLPTTAGAATSPPIAFEVPRVADPIHTYGEPDIGIAPNQAPYVAQPSDRSSGEVYVSGPTGTGTQRSIWQGSVDGGHTFRTISRNPLSGVIQSPCDITTGVTPLCGPIAAPGGGDTEINFDHSRKQYFADLYALACQHTATRTTNNAGAETVNENTGILPFGTPLGGCPVPGSDRQWILVKDACVDYGPAPASGCSATPRIYMEANTVGSNCNGPANGGGGWYVGSDGLTYASAEPGQPGGVANTYCPFGADGYPSIDQQTGKVFQAEFGTVNNQDAIQLNIGSPVDAAGDLCFLDHSTGIYTPLNPDGCAGKPDGPNPNKLVTIAVNSPALNDVVNDANEAANFVVSSMDRGRNLWVAWVNHASDPAKHQAWVSMSPPGPGNTWSSWSTPVKVSSAPSRVSILPWIQAGDPGRADVVWYGDSTLATPSDTSASHRWDVYMAQVVFPTPVSSAQTPSVSEVKVTPHPMDLTDVCLLGTTCVTALGNRNLADFFEVRVDNTGAAMIVYDDMSNGYCQPIGGCPSIQGADHAGSPVVTIARQSSGPGLFSDPQTGQALDVSGPSNAPVSGLADAAGDARVPVFGGTNVPQMDIIDHRLAVSGQTLTITMKTAGDPRDVSGGASAAGCALCSLQFVTRWQMGTHLFYGMFENSPNPLMGQQFYAGESKTIDDCSVSACDPHVLTYPEAPPFGLTGHAETGTVTCPTAPSAANPCTITEQVNLADVGAPANNALFEEVAGYSFLSLLPQGALTQVNERLDNGASEIDGVCCYNFQASGVVPPPTATPTATPTANPTTLPNTSSSGGIASLRLVPAVAGLVLLVGAALVTVEGGRRRRRGRRV